MARLITYLPPVWSVEYDEATRFPEFADWSVEQWVAYGEQHGVVTRWSELGPVANHDEIETPLATLHPDKVTRFRQAVTRGTVHRPIVLRWADGTQELLGGNTRLLGLRQMGLDPEVVVLPCV